MTKLWRQSLSTALAFAMAIGAPAGAEERQCRDSSCIQQLPGFSCPPAKVWEQSEKKLAVCVDCRGRQPPPEQRVLGCESNKVGQIVEGRDYFCIANSWRASVWQLISNTCVCPEGTKWDSSSCVRGQETDECENIPGIQSTVPVGYIQIEKRCYPIRGGGSGQGYMWGNGAEDFWNTMLNQLHANAPGWMETPPPYHYIRQAVEYLANRWMSENCDGVIVKFGEVGAYCMRSWLDIPDTQDRPGPYYWVEIAIW